MEESGVSQEVESAGAGHGRVPGLVGVRGRLRAEVDSTAVALITVDDGAVTLSRGGGEAESVLKCESESDALAILRGELNPVVAALQGRLEISGDLILAIKTLNAIRAASPFKAAQPHAET